MDVKVCEKFHFTVLIACGLAFLCFPS